MNIAVSACLLGTPCRYDGESRPCAAALALRESGHKVVPVCPEVLGGLSIPHPPSEIQAGELALRVLDAEGGDTTQAFVEGAQKTLERVQEAGCTLAVLKAKSPSCGAGRIYDGSFTGTLVPGYGIAARLLRAEGVRVIDEVQLAALTQRSKALRPESLPPLLATTAAECPALHTERLVLHPLSPADAPAVFAYSSDPVIGHDAGWEPHRTEADSLAFIQAMGAFPHVFGIFERAQAGQDGAGPCIGSLGLIPDPHRSNPDCLMLGYALARQAWGHGYMTEAVREVLRYGFEEVGVALITATHYPFNDRSRRVLEKCGFQHEGTLHQAEVAPDGTALDMVSYQLPAQAWRKG